MRLSKHSSWTVLIALGTGLAACEAGDTAEEPAERTGSARSALGQPLGSETEPNGVAVDADPIPNDTVVRADIYPAGDSDYFSFQAAAGSRVYAAVASAFSANTSTDADLQIIASDGTTVLEYDDLNGSLGGLAPSIAGTTLPTDGTYYVRAFHFNPASLLTPYDLHFKVQQGLPTPEQEPNDMTPQPLPASGWITGNLSAVTDVDVYSISLQAGDTVFASLDLDPTRDGTEFNGVLSMAPFSGTAVQVNDGGGAGPDSEALFTTVNTTGTFGIGVSGAAAGDYMLSVSVHPAAPSTGCTTYTSTDVPKVIPTGPGQVTSVINVPSSVRAGDVDVSLQLNHASPLDVDAHLISPAGNTNGLFTDIGSATLPSIATRIDDEAAVTISSFPNVNGTSVQPENVYRLSWLDGENPAGTWTLVLDDDTANNGGTLSGWSITICDQPVPAVTCSGGNPPTTAFSTGFEAGAAVRASPTPGPPMSGRSAPPPRLPSPRATAGHSASRPT